MNVLSLFDGISGARQALKELNIDCPYYAASEIDKYAIQIAMKNHPDNINLGDVCNIKAADLPSIDLLVGGSPCQSLSIAACQKESGLDKGKSVLFWEYVRLLREVKPKYFLLENVASMKYHDAQRITQEVGVLPIMLDSALLTAQSRKRLYWTNIPGITEPKNLGIMLKDILEADGYLGNKNNNKSSALLATYYKENVKSLDKRNKTTVAKIGENIRKLTPIECERLQGFSDNYTDSVSTTQRYKALGNSFTVPIIKHMLSFMKGGDTTTK